MHKETAYTYPDNRMRKGCAGQSEAAVENSKSDLRVGARTTGVKPPVRHT
jgi:hypothetical protein